MSFADLPVRPPVAPMLAKLARELPSGEYIYEPKWDGFRCIVFRSGTEVELGSRNELPLTRYFPELVRALSQVLPQRAVLDGEVVVAGPTGLDFDALSQRVHPAESRVRLLAEKTPASFIAFDLLALDDRDLRKEPFHERRRLLESVIGEAGPSVGVHLTPATRDRSLAEDWFGRFEGAGLDGVVAKGADLAYVAGKRVMVKVKHERTAEFVVGGFRWYRTSADGGTPGQSEVGSLMLGLYDSAGDLSHVGVIGAFTAEQRRQLVEVLAPYRVGNDGGPERHPWAGWATATEAAGPRLPGPGAVGTRRRTSASSCSVPTWWSKLHTSTCRARVCAIPPSSGVGAQTAMRGAAPTTSSTLSCRWSWPTFSALQTAPRQAGAGKALVATGSDFAALTIDGREIRISRPGKVFFPDVPVSKMQLVEYYVSVGEGALRGVYRRPTVLKRFPDGINGEVFFQKRVPAARPDWLHTATVHFPSGRSAEELCPLDVAHIIWAVNLGCVDFNPWPVRDSDLDCSDELRVDLDPMPGVTFDDVRRVAGCVHDVLEELGIPGFPKTSGSRGIHINVPIEPRWGFTDVRQGALALAREVERRMPEIATSKWWKEERGTRVFIDYNQNARATIRLPPHTLSDRCPTPGYPRRSPGTNWTRSTPTS